MRRFYIVLSEEERMALQVMADQARRAPRMQAALLIRQGLEQAGFLSGLSRTATATPAINPDRVSPPGDDVVQP